MASSGDLHQHRSEGDNKVGSGMGLDNGCRGQKRGELIRGLDVLDEIEIFKGEENSLIMTQSYTHKF